MAIEQFTYIIESCIHCSQPHTFLLNTEKKIPLFGGPGQSEETSDVHKEWGFTCPVTKKVFSQEIILPRGLKMKGFASPQDLQAAPVAHSPANNPNAEFQAWATESRTRGLAFGTTMLTTSTGAIGVYFAIEKYLHAEKLTVSGLGLVGMLPPIVYLLASLFFVFALRPKFKSLAASDFEVFRNNRLKQIDYYINLGLIAFLSATFVAIIHFIILLA